MLLPSLLVALASPAAADVAGAPEISPSRPGVAPALARRLRRRPRALHRAWVEGLPGIAPRLGPFVVLEIDAAEARRLAEAGARLHAPPRLRASLDAAAETTGAAAAHQGDGFTRPWTGAGVLVGTYDSGLDLRHPAFTGPDGRLRVEALWDQDDRTGPAPEGFSGGTVCGPPRLRAGRCPSRDPTGHGTHALGAAAGDEAPHRGFAPGSALVLARADAFDRPLEALAWLEEVAASRGRPMVVFLALATQEGPHDGTSPLARALDALPHLAVVAAGNDGEIPLHAALPAGGGRLVFVFPAAPGARGASVEVWSRAPPRVRLLRLDDAGVAAQSAWVGPGDDGRTERFALGDEAAEVDLDVSPEPTPENGRFVARVELRGPAALPSAGRWTLEVDCAGPSEAWMEPAPMEPTVPRFDPVPRIPGQVLGDTRSTISDLATAPGVLAVSGWLSKTEVDGVALEAPADRDRLLAATGYGPTADPARTGPKPELAAPGGWVVAPRASGTRLGLGVGPLWAAGRGTSVAAPLVAGAAALLLEAAPGLDPARLKRHLLESARPPERDPEDPRWGAGRLDAERALGSVAETTGCGCRAVAARRGGPSLGLLVAAFILLARRGRLEGLGAPC